MEASAQQSTTRAAEIRAVLDHALREVDADERAGMLLGTSDLTLQIEFTDLDLVLRLEPSSDSEQHFSWSFNEAGARPKLDLAMDSATANAYLQGRESLAVGIARGLVRCSAEPRVALTLLPALRLICGPYRRWAAQLHPDLVLA